MKHVTELIGYRESRYNNNAVIGRSFLGVFMTFLFRLLCTGFCSGLLLLSLTSAAHASDSEQLRDVRDIYNALRDGATKTDVCVDESLRELVKLGWQDFNTQVASGKNVPSEKADLLFNIGQFQSECLSTKASSNS
jgi:hypothetical protein